MNDKKTVTIYTGNDNEQCIALLEQMDEWEIPYKEKNITDNEEYKKELQDQGIYGTPATFIEGYRQAILGFQKNKLEQSLGLGSFPYR
ncbi:glutaredoxin family protein [Lentibacillus sediminis]|uniref:glutaredoxin family protein n=1 Tax=Lentibacillus sediminis TaxID=1940529 RepID=UPI000C1C6B38|nr:glutaredoxin family protein [Lentibacillus sediminis]